jgi:hypothetical protein
MTDQKILQLSRQWLTEDRTFKNFVLQIFKSLHGPIPQEYVVMGRRLDDGGIPKSIPCLSVYYSTGINPGYVFPLSKDAQSLTQDAWIPNSISSELTLKTTEIVLLEGQNLRTFMDNRQVTVTYHRSAGLSNHTDELLLLTREEFEILTRELTESTA